MTEQIIWWAVAINVVLLTRVVLVAPNAIKLAAKAAYLHQKAAILQAQIEQEKIAKGLTQTDFYRELREYSERLKDLRDRASIAEPQTSTG